MSDTPVRNGRTGDPFALFRAELMRERQPGQRFGSGEHVWIGNEGLFRACTALNEVPADYLRIRRGLGDDELTYGEIVALSGDFYPSPEALFDEKPALLPWFWEDNDLSDLQAAFAKELSWIAGAHDVDYPDNNLAYAWNAKSYVELALDNDVHFGWHNIVAYCRHHEAALQQALHARTTGDPADWRRAMYTNGFADHFLTDAFAAGHIRVPRTQTRRWAREKGYDEKLAGGLSKLVHDQDGHVNTLHAGAQDLHGEGEGLRVLNTNNDEWFTRCDSQLFIARVDDPAIEQPVAAVAASCRELLLAFQKGQNVPGVFAPLLHVPFPHPGIPSFCEKFSAGLSEARLDDLMRSVEWYIKIPWIGPGLKRLHVREYFNALPAIMAQFRADVAAAVATRDHTFTRMPRAYIEAFKRIE